MALIKCKECGNEISDKAKACPKCGYPIFLNENDNQKEETFINYTDIDGSKEKKNEDFVSTYEDTKFKKGKINFIICSMLLILLVVIIFFLVLKNLDFRDLELIPSLYNVSEDNAVNILTNKGFISNLEYDFSDDVAEGNVIRTIPSANTEVERNSSVTIYVSKGPYIVNSKNSNIQWLNIDYSKEDKWSFKSPYLENGLLYIECTPTFGVSFDWEGFGSASISDTFDKSVPIEIIYDNEHVVAKEEQNITLIIPTDDLGIRKTTNVHLDLVIKRNNKQQSIKLNFKMTW